MKINSLGLYLVFSQIVLILQPWVTYFNLNQEEFSQLLLVRAEMVWLLSLSVLGLPLLILAEDAFKNVNGGNKFRIFYILMMIGSVVSIVVNLMAGNKLINEVSNLIISILIIAQSMELISKSIYMKVGKAQDLNKDLILQVPLLILMPFFASYYDGVVGYFTSVILSNFILVLSRLKRERFSSEQTLSVSKVMEGAKSMALVGLAGFMVAPLQSIVQRLSFEQGMPSKTIEIAIIFQIYGLLQMLPSTISKMKLIVERKNNLSKMVVRLKTALVVVMVGVLLAPVFDVFLKVIEINFSDSTLAFLGIVVSVGLMTFQLEFSNFRLRNKDYKYGILINALWCGVVVVAFYLILMFLKSEKVGVVLSISMLIGYTLMLIVNLYLHRMVDPK